MSFLKLTRSVRVTLVALAMLAASSQTARAETIFLTCSVPEPNKTFTVDLAKNTVNNLPANINQTAIDWQEKLTTADAQTVGVQNNHTDRTAGTLTQQKIILNDTGTGPNGVFPPRTVPCTKSSVPATQF
jgi:hypothetical protein